MPVLLTRPRYKAITGDTFSGATLDDYIEEATELLAEMLDRPLESAARTERMIPTRDGRLWPRAIPITVVPSGYVADGWCLQGVGWWTIPFTDTLFVGVPGIDVTYTGGWVERSADPTAVNALPLCIERDLAFAAFTLRTQQAKVLAALNVPAGVASTAVGDVSVSYGKGGATPQAPSEASYRWSRRTLGYRHTRIGGDVCFY